ncbi:hypothetical protein XENTR_v10010139 [Xenopus tropicalis]|uniref:A.superbus venom factor 1 n=2 Tax=Xenopus tropicalis TaxID=8364 RepID=A0A6I8Q3I4_XENTR|nr:A.superbus venom factor 1 [Xenopus tropicalis]KAE8620188.1 hypothetical protein XENTR_v10010139 [Xenopus tropicalis]
MHGPGSIMGTAAGLCLLLLLAASSAEKPCVLITPAVLHAEMEETFMLEAPLHTSEFEAKIQIQDFPLKLKSLAKATVKLNAANGFQGEVKIQLSANDLPKDSNKKQFAYVIVDAPDANCKLEKIVLLSFESGYIFIQTDKTLYTPGSNVLYRLFISNPFLAPDNRTVTVEIVNPDKIVLEKASYTSSAGIVSKNFILPDIANVGMWRIISRFQAAPQQTFHTEFECKEYVLPTFEVLLETPQPYFFLDENEFVVDVKARFLHGKEVEGSGYVVFGAMEGNEKMNFPDSLTKIEVVNGEARAVLKSAMLMRRFPVLSLLLGKHLYVTVTVLTNAGSDMVEAERTGIPVVDKAFNLLFTKSSNYFKPGLPYTLWISIENPDGSPASAVSVCTLTDECRRSDKDGTAQLVINTPADSTNLEVKMRTEALDVLPHRQATGTFTIQAYKPQGNSKNYLHVDIMAPKVGLYNNLPVNFYVRSVEADESIQKISFMVLSKGRIVHVGKVSRQKGQGLVVTSIPVNEKFMPSFRIVAYYIAGKEGQEIVSDSASVDIQDSCMGKIEFRQNPKKMSFNPQPGNSISMLITGDPGAHVGLVAVDKAVFVLNKKNRISQAKIWKELEASDLGCTIGGGSDNAAVFTDAGLSVVTNIGLNNPIRQELRCSQGQRKRRSVPLTGLKAKKVQEYKDLRLRRCCEEGMLENPMGYSCQRRAQYVLEAGDCSAIFLECCKFIYESPPVRGGSRGPKRRPSITSFIHATSAGESQDDMDSYMDIKDISSRTIFSESWLWRVEVLPPRADHTGWASKIISPPLPESITTWEFLAVSMSPTKGICVAQPYELTVKKPFFIDLRLPYSVVRNEQVEIRAVLYSYIEEDIEVRVDLLYNQDMCSSATKESTYRQVVKMGPGAIAVIPFVIVPLVATDLQVEVKASVKNTGFDDGVMKKLKVVPEGMKIFKTIQSIILDPLGSDSGKQTEFINLAPRNDIVPKSDPVTYVSVTGNLVAETLENSIDGSKLHHLIMVPSGCGEQNMMSMTPSVIATRYLDTIGQWDRVGLELREKAINTIKKGYSQQLAYRKSDNSYAAFANRPSSTWLTAYVAKVFAMASGLTNIDKDVVCGAVKWLVLKQLPDGMFQEDAPVIHGEMVGGSGQTDPDASLTAFVLIALLEAQSYCKEEVPNLGRAANKSVEYLELRLKTLKMPYSVCIVSYALSLAGRLPNHKHLMKFAQGGTHWADASPHLYSIEATSYALLALLKLGDYHLAGPVSQWLAEQRFYGGGYGSTQATIMVFQALSEYQIHVPLMNDVEMDVKIRLPTRSAPLTWRIDSDNGMVRRSEQTSMEGNITVTATGRGRGTMTIMSVYYVPLSEDEVECKKFDFSVSLQEVPNDKKPHGVIKSMYMNICMKFLGIVDSTMTIVDVAMLTGFTPDTNDLDMLTNRVERYISKYEMDKERSERGSLIIYLDKVSRTENECLKFKIHQKFEVGVLQPAAVTVYEYYTQEYRCTKFYHPTEEQGQLRRICTGIECHCVAERCNLKNAFKGKLDVDGRLQSACEAGVDYVYETRLDKTESNGAYDVFIMTITRIVKLGTDDTAEGKQRQFFSHQSCRDSVKLTEGRTYLIWGKTADLWEVKNEKAYVISGDTWIEEVPTGKECITTQTKLCEEISKFIDELTLVGCTN